MDQPTRPSRPYHEPVMVDETLDWLAPVASGTIVDATFGGGGHSRALLDRFPDVRVVGLDRDPDAVGQAPTDDRLRLVGANYRDLAELAADGVVPAPLDGVLFDLGVSSHQLDEPERGFSYHSDGPVDMRMGPDAERTAADLIDASSADELADILFRYGDEKFARRIAAAIVAGRPFASTSALAQCVSEAVPAAARRRKHPARRTFQALRIAVNDELDSLSVAIEAAIELLGPGGRIVVIAYHSLEDRIVKSAFADHARDCVCPPDLPVCVCGAAPDLSVLTRRAVKPQSTEIANNPRARSAVLRVAEKVSE